MGAIRGLAEVVVLVRDMPASVRFYRDVLGLQVISPAELKGPVFLQAGDPLEGVPQQIVLAPARPDAETGGRRNVHHIGLVLAHEELERERERLSSLGYQIRTGQHPFMAVEAIYVDDPDGNEVELVAARQPLPLRM